MRHIKNRNNIVPLTVIWWISSHELFFMRLQTLSKMNAQFTESVTSTEEMFSFISCPGRLYRDFNSLDQVLSAKGFCRARLSLWGSPAGTGHCRQRSRKASDLILPSQVFGWGICKLNQSQNERGKGSLSCHCPLQWRRRGRLEVALPKKSHAQASG